MTDAPERILAWEKPDGENVWLQDDPDDPFDENEEGFVLQRCPGGFYVLASKADEWKQKADIADQMAEALKELTGGAPYDETAHGAVFQRARQALAAYREAKG